ncbi:DUF3168 domain-containing protein [Aquincola sp. J276]|uniref:tail completion protein gp17 n=1 Tax=Aquincola sp. J276 TaxID=2898432 RepID=UPI0021513EFE|nr:DUF3168 domain-containing protein [Aquincola sp. J276]MCR5864652.1 DUF3168 domain-containing protein [Aquincola sp. J276]
MTPAEELRQILASYAPLTALCGDRIRVDLAREEDDYPFIVFKRVSFQRITGLDGSVHARRDTFQVECWAGSRAASSALAELADEALRAGELDPDESDPDSIDPEIGARAVVLNVDMWSD